MSARPAPHPARDDLIERLRAALDGEPTTREVRMFGVLAFMVRDTLVLAARPQGHLLVHVDPAGGADLRRRPGASQAQMKTRSMGDGWLDVDASALSSDDDLALWVRTALDAAPEKR